jgi:hypothetical protein
MEKYFVIGMSEDGDPFHYIMSKEELEEFLEENEQDFMSEKDLEDHSDSNYWNDSILIIKGEIVIPKPIEVVTKYKL